MVGRTRCRFLYKLYETRSIRSTGGSLSPVRHPCLTAQRRKSILPVMYHHDWELMQSIVSGERTREYTLRINTHARWCEFQEMVKTAEETAALMREAGLEQVELIETPADGRTMYAGWANPCFWHVEDAVLKVIDPPTDDAVLAHYRSNPCSLMLYSKPTTPDGISAEIVTMDPHRADVQGKIVLVEDAGINTTMSLFRQGALGVLCDQLVTDPYIRPPEAMQDVRRWYNYAIPPWDTDQKGFGFSLTPRQGRDLRALLAQSKRVVAHALVKANIGTGPLYVVTGLLPGTSEEEIAITAHLYEWGADDNASGCALGIEIARALADAIQRGEIARPLRGLRLIYGMEVRGTAAYLALCSQAQRLRAGINLDMVGVEQNAGRVICTLDSPLLANPGYHHFFVERLLEELREEYPYFRFNRQPETLTDDNAMGEPLFDAGCPAVWQMPAPHHHNSLDTQDHISPIMLRLMGTWSGTYVLFLMNAGQEQAAWLAQLAYERVRRDVLRECERMITGSTDCLATATLYERMEFLKSYGVQVICSVKRLIAAQTSPDPTADLAERFRRFVSDQERDVANRLSLMGRAFPIPALPSAHAAREARALLPRKAFPGYLGWEWIQFLPETERQTFLKETGTAFGWCAPQWMQMALFWSNGARDLLSIYNTMRAAGLSVSLEQLIACVQALARNGLVTLADPEQE